MAASPPRTRAADLLPELPPGIAGLVRRGCELPRRRAGAGVLATGLDPFDGLLGGGLPRGGLTELVGRGSCGRLTLLYAALCAVTDAGEAAALVDLGDVLDPQAAAEHGVRLERLLWLRPRRLGDAVAAAEMLVETGFPLVALDLGLPPVRGRAPLAAWLRLARGAGERGAVALAASPYRLSGCAAGTVVVARRGRGAWSGRRGAVRLLDGLEVRLVVARRPGARPEEEAAALLLHPEARRPSAAPRRSTETAQEVRHA